MTLARAAGATQLPGSEFGIAARFAGVSIMLGNTALFPLRGARASQGGSDRLSRIQIEQDIAVCAEKLPSLICQPVGLQLLQDDIIVLFAFEQDGDDIKVASEKHYQLVPADSVTDDDLRRYRQRLAAAD